MPALQLSQKTVIVELDFLTIAEALVIKTQDWSLLPYVFLRLMF
jgi:hypothetical protein